MPRLSPVQAQIFSERPGREKNSLGYFAYRLVYRPDAVAGGRFSLAPISVRANKTNVFASGFGDHGTTARFHFGRHSTLKAMMICAGSALPTLFKSSKPLLSLAPASFKLPSSVDLATLHRSSFENS